MTAPLPPLPFRVGALTHVGLVRDENQDNMSRFVSPLGEVFLVVDGMGGHQGGAEAARRVVDGLERHLAALPAEAPVEAGLQQATAATHAEILAAAAEAEAPGRSMGATAVLALVRGRLVTIAHAGDSRAYLLRGGSLFRLTRDHTRIQQMLDHHILTEEQARDHPDASVIHRAFGQGDDLELEIAPPREMEVGDRWLLCTDGLSGYVRDEAIAEVLGGEGEAQAIAGRLIELALGAGGEDNVTVQVVMMTGEPASPRAVAAPTVMTAAPATAMTAPTTITASPPATAPPPAPAVFGSASAPPERAAVPWIWLLVAALLGLALALGVLFGRPALEGLRQRISGRQGAAPPPAPAPPPRRTPRQAPPAAPARPAPPPARAQTLAGPPAPANDAREPENEALAAEAPAAAQPGFQIEISTVRVPLRLRVIESAAPAGEAHTLHRQLAELHAGEVQEARPRRGAVPGTVYYRREVPGARAEARKLARALDYSAQAWPAELGDDDTDVLVVERPAPAAAPAAPTAAKGHPR